MTKRALESLLRARPSLVDALHGADRAAQSLAPILVLGESGTGRSSVARALHAASGRAFAPLVEVDVASIPSTLFESELFGYEVGAFTGAEESFAGRVARAEGGTLLLDHVEEIPAPAQPKLLRLLAERVFAPLAGGDRRADVRFMSIGPQDLARRVERDEFRRDLFHRLEVLTFFLPPLRAARSDIEPVVEFFLSDMSERFGRGTLRLTDKAWDWMREYGWPGNLREVRNVLERAVLLALGDVISPEAPAVGGSRPRSLAEVEAEEIRRALDYTRGHQGRAAEILGISRKTLWEKRKRYKLP